MLAGIVLVVGQAWALWGRAWLDRAYLRTVAAPVVTSVGLAYAREGLRAAVRATGTQGETAYEVRWTLRGTTPTMWARTGRGKWCVLTGSSSDALQTWLTTLSR